ncbi:class I SAM-dependent DNA methyltransferase [Streptomyces sp. NPDC005728]|uniref:type I restriction-modification system subunit M n=1 Tax=Streptomyces sp. NPDC005728 TaxID=3157054 RepID=UPI00340E6507
MITGELKSKIDRLWDAFWSGGISNPLEVIEQITYLMFIRRLDILEQAKENRANRTGRPVENPIYTDDTQVLRWSVFINESPENMLTRVRDGVFPWLRTLGGEESTYAHHMKDARFTITTSNLLTKAVDMINGIDMGDKDTKGDLYEYMLGKIATAGQNGQFRTPRHIIQLMVEMMAPQPGDEICDPACGTAGFLVASAEYVERTHREALFEPAQRQHFNESMFHGFDFDNTMLRIGSMNMLLHSVENPDIRHRDSLAQSAAGEADQYSLVLANPPFAGSLDSDATASDLQKVVKTKKTELLFLALFLRLLKPGGRAAVIVPEGVLFGSSKAHKDLRKLLVEGHKLDAVVKLPGGVFKPYAGVSTAILFFTKTNSGGTDDVWFYEVASDGWSLDDKRAPLLSEEKLGPLVGDGMLNEAEHAKNNLPDVLARWRRRNGSEQERARTEQSFCVPKEEIAAQDYDLSLNRYKETVHEEVEHRAPGEIMDDLARIESEIQQGMSELKILLTAGSNGRTS